MDIRVVCLVHSEADIWEQSLARLVALFTHVYVVIQTPTDRTPIVTSVVQQRNPGVISSYSLAQNGYFRSEVSKLFADLAFSQGADWVLFADADEVIRANNRSDLERVLSGNENTVVSFRRRNLVPSEFGSSTSFSLRQSYRTLPESSELSKVAVSAGWASRFPQFEFASNVTAVAPWSGAKPISGATVGEYLHIPVRSLDRLRTKVEAGIAAYEATFRSDHAGVARWRAIGEGLRGGGNTNTLTEIALHYGVIGSRQLDPSASTRAVEENAFVDGTVPIASSASEAEATAAVADTVETAIWRSAPLTRGKRLALLSGTEVEIGLQPVSGRGTARGGRFGTLPGGAQLRLDQRALTDAIGSAFQRIETPLSADAAVHIPALFFLWRLLAPRRYVELGSRQGMTFFAACQAAKGQEEAGECVAIDVWTNDQTPLDEDRSFVDFEYLLSTRYPQVGHYVRGETDDAAWCFEDESIDLLYIDGCRENATVKHDFDVWRPKMSERGVMLLHGTLDPGAGDSWTEIEAKDPSWNLAVGRGLGVVYVGDPASEATRLLAHLRGDARWSEALTEMAKGAASLSLAEARRAVAQLATSKEEITQERLSREREKAAIQATSKVHASLSWRLTAPLRLAGQLFRRVGGSRNE